MRRSTSGPPVMTTSRASTSAPALYLAAGSLAHAIFTRPLRHELQRGGRRFVHICETPTRSFRQLHRGALYPPPLQPPWAGRSSPIPESRSATSAGGALLSAMTLRAVRHLSTTARTPGPCPTTWSRRSPERRRRGARDRVRPTDDSQAEGPSCTTMGHRVRPACSNVPRAGGRRGAPRIVLIASAREEDRRVGRNRLRSRPSRHELGAAAAMVNLDGGSLSVEREIWSSRRRHRPDGRGDRATSWTGPRPGDESSSRSSDHAPFGDAGVPSRLSGGPTTPTPTRAGTFRDPSTPPP